MFHSILQWKSPKTLKLDKKTAKNENNIKLFYISVHGLRIYTIKWDMQRNS